METTLPGDTGAVTSRLGFGMATLMREGSARRRRYTLEAALDRGYRHFDVAPLYGLGHAESDLGRFLTGASARVTVGTKFGLRPSVFAQLAGMVQRPLRWTIAHSAPLKRIAHSYAKSATRLDAPQAEDVLSSVDASLRSLGLQQLDLLLMHDMPWDEPWARLWRQLSETDYLAGVNTLGIASSVEGTQPYPSGVLTGNHVLQSPASLFGDLSTKKQEPFRIEFGLLAGHLSSFCEFLQMNQDVRRAAEEIIGSSLRQRHELAAFLASISLAKDSRSILIIGTTNAQHAQAMWENVESRIIPTSQNYLVLKELMSTYWQGKQARPCGCNS